MINFLKVFSLIFIALVSWILFYYLFMIIFWVIAFITCLGELTLYQTLFINIKNEISYTSLSGLWVAKLFSLILGISLDGFCVCIIGEKYDFWDIWDIG